MTQQEANFWVELPQAESDRISELAVSALRDVYGVQHPIFLAPDQLAEVPAGSAADRGRRCSRGPGAGAGRPYADHAT